MKEDIEHESDIYAMERYKYEFKLCKFITCTVSAILALLIIAQVLLLCFGSKETQGFAIAICIIDIIPVIVLCPAIAGWLDYANRSSSWHRQWKREYINNQTPKL
jgi:hypothetical protein